MVRRQKLDIKMDLLGDKRWFFSKLRRIKKRGDFGAEKATIKGRDLRGDKNDFSILCYSTYERREL